MKRLLALLMIGAILVSVLPAFAYFPGGKTPEFAKQINGEWSDIDNPVTLEGLHYCETVEVSVWALFFEDLYAYNFTLTWTYSDPTVEYLWLEEAEVKHIHSADFVIIGGEDGIDNEAHTYTQAVTAIAPATGWGDGESMVAVANLYFHIENDAQWPYPVTITFCFGPANDQTAAIDSCTVDIPHDRQEAYLLLMPCQPTLSMEPAVIYKSVKGETFEVQFKIECAVKIKSFHFVVTWDARQLKTDAQNVWIKDFLPPPYESTSIEIGSGALVIDVQMPCEKPLRNGTGELFGIRFTAKNPWPYNATHSGVPDYFFEAADPPDIPHPIWYPEVCWNYINIAGYFDKDTDGLTIQTLCDPTGEGVRVRAPNIDPLQPGIPFVFDPYTLNGDADDKYVYSGDGASLFDPLADPPVVYECPQGGNIIGYYEFRPIPGDLSLDGHVDIEDLSAMAKAYGYPTFPTDPYYAFFDLDGDGQVDLTDVVIVAKNFCRTEPELELPWPIFDP